MHCVRGGANSNSCSGSVNLAALLDECDGRCDSLRGVEVIESGDEIHVYEGREGGIDAPELEGGCRR